MEASKTASWMVCSWLPKRLQVMLNYSLKPQGLPQYKATATVRENQEDVKQMVCNLSLRCGSKEA